MRYFESSGSLPPRPFPDEKGIKMNECIEWFWRYAFSEWVLLKRKFSDSFYFYIFYDCCCTQPFHKRLKKHEVVWKQSGRCKLLFLSTDSKIATFIVSKLFHLLLGFRKIWVRFCLKRTADIKTWKKTAITKNDSWIENQVEYDLLEL